MSTTSESAPAGRREAPRARRRLVAALLGAAAGAAALAGCIQGPWSYYPEETPIFRGIWLTGYAVAGRPFTQVCMERLLALDEEATDAFAFYDSAAVGITGRFADGATRTVALAPDPERPNCFLGDSSARVAPGEAYALDARVVWDSAGSTVESRLTATARVPARFSIRDTANAPQLARAGGAPSNILDPAFLAALPPAVQATLLKEFYLPFQKLEGDTAAQAKFIRDNFQKAQQRLVKLMEPYTTPYAAGDTLFYLSGAFNTLSHYFDSDYSDDVGGVLITHRFDTAGERPQTAFEGFFGDEPDTADYFYEGSIRRLGLYPAARTAGGYNLLDSIGVVNTWFHTRLNRLYFYGAEDAYVEYVLSALEAEDNPRILVRHNVSGGRGIFAGMVPDSFDITIKVDSLTKAYPLPIARAHECREDGWFDPREDCAGYYRAWCRRTGWEGEDCRLDAVRAGLEALLFGDTALGNASAHAVDSARAASDTAALNGGELRFCVERNFPSGGAVGETCESEAQTCGRPGVNGCKEAWWNFCRDAKWRPAGCLPALAWYCRDKGRSSEVMCRAADDFCRANPDEAACR